VAEAPPDVPAEGAEGACWRPPPPVLWLGVAVGVDVGVGVWVAVEPVPVAGCEVAVLSEFLLEVWPGLVAAATVPRPSTAASDPTAAPNVRRRTRRSDRSRSRGVVGCCCTL
jgi:hypothetical protein